LTRIHLDEKNVGAALETVARTRTDSLNLSTDVHLRVARAAETTHPREALAIYLRATEHIVKERERWMYGDACKYLLRVRDPYRKLGEEDACERYLRKLKAETKTLRAFNQEMGKARL
jgi:uncharacterized Zn finger protein